MNDLNLNRPIVPPPRVWDGMTLVSLGGIAEPAPYIGPWGGRLATDYPTILYGEGGQGKSLLALALATAVACEKPFAGFKLPQGPALYVDFELGLEEQLRRAYRIARGFGLERPPADLLYFQGDKPILKLCPELKRIISGSGIHFLVIDSLGPGAGVNPEDAEAIIPVMNAVKDLKVTSLLIDHQSKRHEGQSYGAKTPFGSVFKFNLARSVLQLERKDNSQEGLKLLLTQVKHNFGPLSENLGLTANFTRESVSFEAADLNDGAFNKEQNTAERVIDAMTRPMTAKELALEAGLSEKTVKNILTGMSNNGRVEKAGKQGLAVLWQARGRHPVPNPRGRDGMTTDPPLASAESKPLFFYQKLEADPKLAAEVQTLQGLISFKKEA